MSETEAAPRLYFDFDGTLVHKYSGRNLRNWTKYPLPVIRGSYDFLDGVKSAGVELGNVITRRGERSRGFVTRRSIENLGLFDYLDPTAVQYANGELEKANLVVAASKKGKIGMLEDRPDKLVPNILGLVRAIVEPVDITIGVVDHPDQNKRICTTLGEVGSSEKFIHGYDGTYTIEVNESFITLVSLRAYSRPEGVRFGEILASN